MRNTTQRTERPGVLKLGDFFARVGWLLREQLPRHATGGEGSGGSWWMQRRSGNFPSSVSCFTHAGL
jgi:hypothetical protein